MLTRFERYVFKETLIALIGVVGILMMILLANQFARILGDAASGDLPRQAIMPLLGLTSITYLTVLVPVAVLVSVMLALGRLFHESEMAAGFSCGVPPRALLKPIVAFAVVVSVMLAGFTFFLAPWAAHGVVKLKADAAENVDVARLSAGRFSAVDSGRAVVYAESIKDDTLSNVFMSYQDASLQTVVMAQTATQRVDDAGAKYLVMQNGERYEGQIGQGVFRRMAFATHSVPIAIAPITNAARNDVSAWPSRDVWQTKTLVAQAEWQWRWAAPLMTLVLAILAVGLAHSQPRQGRYNRLLWGILAYVVYANITTTVRKAMEEGGWSPHFGLWIVHGLALVLALAWYRKMYRIGSAKGARRVA